MGDEDGNATVDPEAARFFAFTYTDKESNRPYGQVTCSVIDNSSLKVYFDTQITADMLPEDKPYWFRFLRELRRMAKSHMLNFDVRDITKDVLSRQDLQYMTKLNPEKKKITKESITEGRVVWQRRGKVSEGDLNNVRIHVVHSEKMLENSNNRLLKVDRIFCVNENGEKFLLPFKSVSGAKAMANHIGRGGNPYDTNGQVISRAVSEMRNLGRFASATRTKTFESEEANNVISAAQQMKESIRGHLARLTNNSRSFTESLEALNKLLPESEHDITELKGWFTTQAYNENLDNYLASAAGAYQRLKENAFEIAEAPGGVEQKVMSPEFKLVLKADPAMDKLMTSRKYADNTALLTAVLGDIANRCIAKDGDDIANFASMMGDLISSEGEAFGQRPDPDYARDKKLAIMLAQKYMKDLAAMRSNPEYAGQVRQDPDARALMKDRKGKSAGDEFEEAIMGIGEAAPANEKKMDKEHKHSKQEHEDDKEIEEAAKPDFLDVDKDGNKKESFKKAVKDKKHAKQNESEETTMSKKQIEEMRKLAGLPLMENYIYAAEEDEEDTGEETGDMIDEIEADHEGMAAEGEEHDGEYSDEAGMAKDQLTSAERAASELHDLLDGDEDLPEWVQAKITKAVDYLNMANSTMKSRHEQGDVHKMSEAGAQSEEDQMAEELDALLIAGGDYDKLLRQLAKKYKTQTEVVEYNYEQWLESPIQTESKGKKPDADGDGVPDWADKKPGKDDNEEEKMDEAAEKKADKDYDGDGEVESEKDEVWGSRMKAAEKKKEQKVSEDIAWLQAVAGIRSK